MTFLVRQVSYTADHREIVRATKFDQPSLAVAGALRDLSVLVTDQAPQGDLAAALNRAGVQVMLAPLTT